MMVSAKRRFLILLATLPLVLLLATVLYMVGMTLLEEAPRDFWASLSWAAETITTTGYGADTGWRHPVMVLFVITVQFFGVVLIYMIVPVYLIPYLEERFESRLPQQAPKIRQHVVIYRYGPAVETLLEELSRAGRPALVAEHAESVARSLIARKVQVVYGSDCAAALASVNLDQAQALIANGSDEENAAAILTARQLGFQGEILALVEEPYHRQPLTLAGATTVYTPRHMLAAALAARASRRIHPRVSGIGKLGRKLEVTEVRIDPGSSLAGKTLADAAIGAVTGTTIIGQWVAGRLLTAPTASMRLEPRGILVAVGSSDRLRQLAELAGGARFADRQGPFLIAGYGEVGKKVRELLDAVEEPVEVIDVHGTDGVDIEGDVLDPRTLEAAPPANARAVIIALDSDSATLFATVVIRDRAPDVPIIARVNEAENVERIHRAGADFALSISQVSGQMLAQRLLRQESVAVDPQLKVLKVSTQGLELRHPSELRIRERTGCSVVAVERGDEVLVEFGSDFLFEPDDSVYICGSSGATHRFLAEYS